KVNGSIPSLANILKTHGTTVDRSVQCQRMIQNLPTGEASLRQTQQEGLKGSADGQAAGTSLSGPAMSRRGFLGAATATTATATALASVVAATLAMARSFGPQAEPVR